MIPVCAHLTTRIYSEGGGHTMAAVDYFLKIDGIDGESKDDKHKDEIDIESWSWGETQTGTWARRRRRRRRQGEHAGLSLRHAVRQQGHPEADFGLRHRRAHQEGRADLPQGRKEQQEFLN